MRMFSRKKVLFYPGTTLTKHFPEIVLNWKSVLADFGLQVDVVDNLYSGWALWDQGYQEEFEKHISWLKKKIKKLNAKTILTCSPEAYYIFKTYLEDVEVLHTTEFIYKNLEKVQQFNTGEVSWHDNTTQVRRNNLVEQPREILRAAGFEVKEFDENKERTQCLGTSTGLINNSPRLAAKLALRRARLSPTKVIITDSPEDYLHLRRSTSAQVLELSEVLVEI